MGDLLIRDVTIATGGVMKPHVTVRCRDGRIVDLTGDGTAQAGDTAVDGSGRILAPGFVDLHIHGSGDALVEDGPEALARLSRILPRFGTTSFQPTIIPSTPDVDIPLLRALAKVEPEGAGFAGFFLEGPFLTRAGAACILAKEADAQRVIDLREALAPHPVVFAAAPDFPGVTTILPEMTHHGRPAFITHTAAKVRETLDAIEAGARHATHFYDVFEVPPMDEPGVRPCGAVEAILADRRVSVDFILDGEHVDPIALRMAIACKGTRGVCLISDANVGAGNPPGVYRAFGHEIRFAYPGAPARFTESHPTTPGVLAGSGLTLDQAVRNAADVPGITAAEALEMASLSPARVLELDGQIGRIEPGYAADLVLLTEDLRPLRTWKDGKTVYHHEQRNPADV